MAKLLLGRSGLLGQIVEGLREGGVLIYGPAGIGKSSLLEAASAAATADGWAVSRTTGGAAESGLPYVALFDLLGPLLDRGGHLLAPHLRAALTAAFLRSAPGDGPVDLLAVRMAALELVRLATARRRLLLVCDDVQWMDTASADALAFVTRRLPTPGFRTLAAERVQPDDLPGLARLCGNRCTELAVPQLSQADTTALLRVRFGAALPSGLMRRVSAASGGNPYLAGELGRAATQSRAPGGSEPLSVPEKLRAMVGKRVAALPARVREVLLLAAVAARPTRQLLAACHAGADRYLAEAADAGVVLNTPEGSVRFVHPLLAEIVYSDASPADRRAAHRAIAEHLDDPVERARQAALAQPEPDEAVAAALDEAAEVARWRGAPLIAAELAELAAQRTPAGAPLIAAKRILSAAEYAFAGGDPDRARRLAEIAVEGGDRATRVAARLLTIDASGANRGRLTSVFAAALADAGDDPALAARVWRCQIDQASDSGDIPGARDAAVRATLLAERAGEPQLIIDALVGRGMAETAMGTGEGESFLHRAFIMTGQAGIELDTPVIQARQMWAVTLARHGDTAAASRAITELIDDVERAGRLRDLGYTLYCASSIYMRDGHCADAFAAGMRGGNLLLDTEPSPGLGMLLLGCGELYGGSLDQAARRLDAAAASFAEVGHDEWLGVTLGSRGRIHLMLGQTAAAASTLRRGNELLIRCGYADPAVFPIAADLAEALVAAGELAEAARVLAVAREQVDRLGRAVIKLGLARAGAMLTAAHGDHRAAAIDLRAAMLAHASGSYPIDVARAWLTLARLERRARRRAAAREAAANACSLFAAIGTPAWLGVAESEAASVEGSTGEESLSPVERQIVELVCAGATNREIATGLHLSVKAVEGSLTKLFRRLGVRNRAELVHHFDALAPVPRK